MSDDRIEAGDIVNIWFGDDEGSHYDKALVLYVPNATGDSWHIKTAVGELVYVMKFETMHLCAKGRQHD